MRAGPLTAAAACFAAAAVLVTYPVPRAEAKPPASDVPKPVPLRADALKRLRSGDPVVVKGALDEVRTSALGGAPAAPVIAELLQQGLTPSLTQAAIDTLGDTESEAGSAALGWYAHHRNVELRRAAVQALSRTRGPVAVKSLRLALSDPDPNVRGLAATGLGSMKAKDTVGDLFVALEHKVPEAAASIGQLCAGNECERLAGKLGSVPFDVVTSGLDQVLFRAPTDVSDDIKVKIVGRVRELGTGEANRFLRSVQGKWPKTWSQRVKQAIDQAVIATSGSPGTSAGDSQ
ncbi:MAG TPA: HEAT repeat domain-containing protein [Polyangiaceae bacterium]|jgi:HEAT repeat protein